MAFAVPSAFAAKPDQGTKVQGPTITVTGQVTNTYSKAGVPGANVTFQAANATFSAVTDGTGSYSVKVAPNNTYTMSFAATNYTTYTASSGSLVKTKNTVINAVLTPVARVIVKASFTGTPTPGATLTATASYQIMDGSTVVPAATGWTQTEGLEAVIGTPLSNTTTVKLGTATQYAAHLVNILKSPPISAADLPPDVKLQPINEIEKGLQDRNQVVAVNPFALEKAEAVPLKFTVKTTSGTYSASLSLVTQLPWVVNPGVKTVPVNVPVMLLAKCGDVLNETTEIFDCLGTDTFSWSITAKPAGSSAALTDAATRSPWFTPDRVGTYQITKAASNKCVAPAPGASLGQPCTTNAQCNTGTSTTNGRCDLAATLDVYAGRYFGVIDPVDTLTSVVFGDGRPVADDSCTGCHTEGGAAPDNFTPWRLTGHAEAFTDGITTNTHFGENCFACHSVGFDRDSAGGIDNTPNYTAFVNFLKSSQASGLPADIAGNWETMLLQYPDVARKSNIQCENCHGPQNNTDAHRNVPGAPRVSLGSEVCGSCHGEPKRHGRFQQWQLSSHADYDLARERGAPSGITVGNTNNCARCHSGNGFVQWSGHDFDPAFLLNVTWDQETVVPQTCQTCHDPHDTGTTSGGPQTDAKVRKMGDTSMLLAGFVAQGVGRAATCMSCHNSRGGVQIPASTGPWYGRNDATWSSLTAAQKTGTPHHGVQADLLMGQNAYFMSANDLVRGKHSLIPDVCVTCHMEKTLPPDILSYNKTGTNHTFAADPNVCSQCHSSGVTAANTDAIVVGYMSDLATAEGNVYKRILTQHYPVRLRSTSPDASCPGTASVSSPVTIDGATVTIANVAWVYSSRIKVTTSDGQCYNVPTTGSPSSSPASTNFTQITVSGVLTALQDFALLPANENVWKAVWNYGLLLEDSAARTDHPGARGVHNPDFSIKALIRATTAVNAVSGS